MVLTIMFPNFKAVLRQQSKTLKHPDDASTADSDFSDSTNVPRRNLRVHDVAGLILNKVVGSRNFTSWTRAGVDKTQTYKHCLMSNWWYLCNAVVCISVSFQESTDFP